MRKTDTQIDGIVRIALIALLIYLSFLLIYPLLGVLAWSFILSVALYPLFNWLNKRIGNRPHIAATLITLFSLLIIVSTLVLLTNNLVESFGDLSTKIRAGQQVVPQPPTYVREWPVIGEELHQFWSSVSSNLGEEIIRYSNYLINAGSLILTKVAYKGFDLLLFIISVILAGYLMTQAKRFMVIARKLADRVALSRGADFIQIMKETIQNVSRGVIGISLLQALVFGLILLSAKVPLAGLLTFLALILCIIQAGLFLLVIPIIIWLFFVKSFVVACLLTGLLVLDTLMDSFLKPIVLSRGLTTPMMLIFIGVVGGVIVYGLIGVFVGPVVLAIFYDLLTHWLDEDE